MTLDPASIADAALSALMRGLPLPPSDPDQPMRAREHFTPFAYGLVHVVQHLGRPGTATALRRIADALDPPTETTP